MHQSISTLDKPEFINLQPLDINPLMQSCEIKVLYLGENRNHSYISKDVAMDMAKSLRGAPIVGYYKSEAEDFRDHGEKVIFEDGEIKFECNTVPYGFVSPDAKVWFQNFEEKDKFGNTIVREYLMTTGYLWTGQFEEANLAVSEGGRPQSMELDEKTLNGEWSTNFKTGMDFFIINDAIFSKLCILGEDVEPCFEGSTISAPKVSTSFTKIDDDFKKTLFTMMQDLKTALEGGKNMAKLEEVVVETPIVEEQISEKVQDISEQVNNEEIKETTEDTTSEKEVATEEIEATTETDFACKEDKKKDYASDKEEENSKEEADKKESKESKENDNEDSKEDNKEEDEKKKYSLLEEKYNELESKFNALTEEYEVLKKFKAEAEDAKKDELIDGFYMLDDSEKKEIKDNKAKFSLDDIEAKLSILYTRKSMKLDLERQQAQDASEKIEENVTTYSLAESCNNLPDWAKAVLEVEKEMNF